MESLTSGTMSTDDEVDVDLEDLTWALMQKSGFMSGIKSQILQFIQENGNGEQEFSVIPDRANPAILSKVYEYLDWIGLKETCMKLLAESPVEIEIMKEQSDEVTDDHEPTLCKMFQSIPEVFETEIKNTTDNNDETKPIPLPLNDTYNITTGNKTQEDLLLKETEDSNVVLPKPLDGEGPISISSYEGESEKTEDISMRSTAKLIKVGSTEHLILLPQQLPNSTAEKLSSNAISSSNEVKNNSDEGDVAVLEKVDASDSDFSDPSARLLQLLSFSDEKVNPPVPVSNIVESDGDPSKDQSAMSSVAEEPSMISDMSFYLSTEDLSLDSSVNGMSSTEHKFNLK